MRLWSLHPEHLDARGLVALWREALLARAVLAGKTRGYVSHPQLVRFRGHPAPMDAIEFYLGVVLEQSAARGYAFDAGKLAPVDTPSPIDVSAGQLEYETDHLAAKLHSRSPADLVRLEACRESGGLRPHPSFRVLPGGVADWERH